MGDDSRSASAGMSKSQLSSSTYPCLTQSGVSPRLTVSLSQLLRWFRHAGIGASREHSANRTLMATPQRARPRREREVHSQSFTVGLCKAQEFGHRRGVGAPTADSTTRTLMMTPARSRPRCERGIRFQTFLLGLKEAVGEKSWKQNYALVKSVLSRKCHVQDSPKQTLRAARARRADAGQKLS